MGVMDELALLVRPAEMAGMDWLDHRAQVWAHQVPLGQPVPQVPPVPLGHNKVPTCTVSMKQWPSPSVPAWPSSKAEMDGHSLSKDGAIVPQCPVKHSVAFRHYETLTVKQEISSGPALGLSTCTEIALSVSPAPPPTLPSASKSTGPILTIHRQTVVLTTAAVMLLTKNRNYY